MTSPGDTAVEKEIPEPARGAHAVLYLALPGFSPSLGGRAFDLGGVDELVIGREDVLSLRPTGPRAARLDLPDANLSARHVRLRLGDGVVVLLDDLGSRNGTLVAGQRVKEARLAPGDAFVAGRGGFVVGVATRMAPTDPWRLAEAPELATFDPGLHQQHLRARELAPSRVPLLIGGETGTGKEILARQIHHLSGRAGPLVPVNCAALPETLVESELFGYRRGAFSEAREDRPGLVRAASGGTLLLDEIGDMPAASQTKLLRVLQDGEVLALGATAPVRVDVRVIAATQRRLADLVAAGSFRADLLGRLAGYSFTLPPLRQRLSDLGLLVAAFLDRHAGAEAARYRITAKGCAELLARRYPLNVRELERAIEAAVQLARDQREIGPEHLPPPAPGGDLAAAPAATVGAADRRAELLRLLQRHRGNVSAVARELGKARMQIHRWMDELGIDPVSFRG